MKIQTWFPVLSAFFGYLYAMGGLVTFLFCICYLLLEGSFALSKYQAGDPLYATLWLGCAVFLLVQMYRPRRVTVG